MRSFLILRMKDKSPCLYGLFTNSFCTHDMKIKDHRFSHLQFDIPIPLMSRLVAQVAQMQEVLQCYINYAEYIEDVRCMPFLGL